MNLIEIPSNSLVMLVGASGSGKSTWARRNFMPTQVVSSDHCRALVSDDEENQSVNPQAFAVFNTLLRQRLALGRLTVADSTALERPARMRMRAIAAVAGRPVCVLAFLISVEELLKRMQDRARRTPEDIILRHVHQMGELVESGTLEEEGYPSVHYLDVEAAGMAVPVLIPPLVLPVTGGLIAPEAAPVTEAAP